MQKIGKNATNYVVTFVFNRLYTDSVIAVRLRKLCTNAATFLASTTDNRTNQTRQDVIYCRLGQGQTTGAARKCVISDHS
jgi:Holliday junction resolvase-like predicted endonuclease